MTFHDILFHPQFSFGAIGGAEFNTSVVRMRGGLEQRNINWSQSGGRWDVSQSIKSVSEITSLISFFRARQGMAYSFRFLDWTDYSVTVETLGTHAGVSATYQVKKTYTSGGQTQSRNITKPIDTTDTNHTLSLTDPSYTTMEVKIGATTLTEGVDYTVAYSTGIITITSGLSGTVTCSCSFHVHTRFDIDHMEISHEGYNLHTWGSIPVIELKTAV